MRNLRRFAIAAAIVGFGAVLLGSWTRINGAGMTCPDWPLCHGKLIPSMSDGTIWEWSHRLFAFSTAPLVAVVAYLAFRSRVQLPMLRPWVVAVAALFLVQVLLGAATVKLGNSPISVVLHWGTAMAFIASLVAIAVITTIPENAREPRSTNATTSVSLLLLATTIAAFATMCVGAYVSSSGAGLACLTLPTCAGHVFVAQPAQQVQMLHRTLAAITFLLSVIATIVVFLREPSPRIRATAAVGFALLCTQVLLGLMNVALRLPTDLREAHAANAALLFIAYCCALSFSLVRGLERPHELGAR
ncbi:MAG: COX15/CtaA family protein [Candidatus Eremiobacteraeota bacterium]|nr:COX15/CtaA family protein [Candidatus Eremiobacteraeota bacterium]